MKSTIHGIHHQRGGFFPIRSHTNRAMTRTRTAITTILMTKRTYEPNARTYASSVVEAPHNPTPTKVLSPNGGGSGSDGESFKAGS